MTFKIGDRVVIKSYTPEDYHHLGEVEQGETYVNKQGVISNLYFEFDNKDNPDGYYVHFYAEDDDFEAKGFDWCFAPSDLQLKSEAVEVISNHVVVQSTMLTLRQQDYDFLLNEFSLDNYNGQKYTRLLKHFTNQQ